MPDIPDGESVFVQGSASKPYQLKNVGGVYSCSCPAWRNQSTAIERRTCKHLRALRGNSAEEARIGSALPQKPVSPASEEGSEKEGAPVLLAERWDNETDLSGWWMSEKLDGVRAYWDGTRFLSRQGNLYHAPDWFVEHLPNTPLDGELWLDRKSFQRTVAIVRRQDKNDLWRSIRFLIFDAPGHSGPFEERLALFRELLQKHKPPYASAHEQQVCTSISHLRSELARIEALGGEGLMLRQPGSRYVAGRSSTLLKVKSFIDTEAVVIGHQPGAGKHKGRLGALLLQLPNGNQFSVGTGFSDAERSNPPPIGSLITFRYQELTDGGIPRFPSFVALHTVAKTAAPDPIAIPGKKSVSVASPQKSNPSAAPDPIAIPGKKSVSVASPQKTNPSDAGMTIESLPADTPRYFEFSDEKSHKFWEVRVSGTAMTVRFGKIGSNGQSKKKEFPTAEKAQKEAANLIRKKLDEGYSEKPSPTE